MKVKIGNKIYKVEFCKTHEISLPEDQLGSINYSNSKIRCADDVSPIAKSEILMHEVVHGLLYERCLKQHHDELVVDNIAKAFVQLIVDNPRLIEKIQEYNAEIFVQRIKEDGK